MMVVDSGCDLAQLLQGVLSLPIKICIALGCVRVVSCEKVGTNCVTYQEPFHPDRQTHRLLFALNCFISFVH